MSKIMSFLTVNWFKCFVSFCFLVIAINTSMTHYYSKKSCSYSVGSFYLQRVVYDQANQEYNNNPMYQSENTPDLLLVKSMPEKVKYEKAVDHIAFMLDFAAEVFKVSQDTEVWEEGKITYTVPAKNNSVAAQIIRFAKYHYTRKDVQAYSMAVNPAMAQVQVQLSLWYAWEQKQQEMKLQAAMDDEIKDDSLTDDGVRGS